MCLAKENDNCSYSKVKYEWLYPLKQFSKSPWITIHKSKQTLLESFMPRLFRNWIIHSHCLGKLYAWQPLQCKCVIYECNCLVSPLQLLSRSKEMPIKICNTHNVQELHYLCPLLNKMICLATVAVQNCKCVMYECNCLESPL